MAASAVPAAGNRALGAAASTRSRVPKQGVSQPLVPSRPALHVLFSHHISAGRPGAAARRAVGCRAADDDDLQETKLGPNVLASVKDMRDNVCWSKATVVRNDAITVNGGQRLLHLTIDDNVDLMYGRTFNGKQSGNKWIDSYTVPGQSVGIRLLAEGGQAASDSDLGRLYGIASSPYESRRDSAYLDSSLIEVVVSRQGDATEQQLASLGPGAQVEVSQVVGRGFASLLNSYEGLPVSLNERRPILLLGIGPEGIGPLRAALNWTPLQAHASSKLVSALYVADSASSAAFLTEWDQWREAGVSFRPLYLQDKEGQPSVEAAQPQQLLDYVLEHILLAGGVSGLLGAKASEATCLVAGATGELASGLSRGLSRSGVPRERILFCSYF